MDNYEKAKEVVPLPRSYKEMNNTSKKLILDEIMKLKYKKRNLLREIQNIDIKIKELEESTNDKD